MTLLTHPSPSSEKEPLKRQAYLKQENHIALRPFLPSDALKMVSLLNSDYIGRDTMIPLPWRLEQANWWIDYVINTQSDSSPREYHRAITSKNRLIGAVALMNIDGHRAEVGYWLDQAYHRKGIMSWALDALCHIGFNNFKLKRLFAPVLTHNTASMKLLESQEFIREGVLHAYFYKDRRYLDAICYARTND